MLQVAAENFIRGDEALARVKAAVPFELLRYNETAETEARSDLFLRYRNDLLSGAIPAAIALFGIWATTNIGIAVVASVCALALVFALRQLFFASAVRLHDGAFFGSRSIIKSALYASHFGKPPALDRFLGRRWIEGIVNISDDEIVFRRGFLNRDILVAIPVNTVTDVRMTAGGYPYMGAVMAISTQDGSELVAACESPAGLKAAIERIRPRFASKPSGRRSRQEAMIAPRQLLSRRVIVALGITWAAAVVLGLGPADSRSPETYPAWTDLVIGLIVVSGLGSIAACACRHRIALPLSILTAAIGLGLSIYDIDFAPAAAPYELWAFGATLVVSVLLIPINNRIGKEIHPDDDALS